MSRQPNPALIDNNWSLDTQLYIYIPACLGKCRCLDFHLTPSYGVNSYNQIVMFTHGLSWYLCPNSLTVLYTALHSVFILECPD